MRRKSYYALAVLFLLDDGRDHYGTGILKKIPMLSGTLYPLLWRLEREGLLRAAWEQGDPAELGRPRRRYYSITQDGHSQLLGMMDQLMQDTKAWAKLQEIRPV